MKVIDAEKLQKEDLHESVFYLEKYKNSIGILRIFDNEQNIYKVNNNMLVMAVFDEKENILEGLYKCVLVEEKPKRKYKKLSLIRYKFSEFATNEYRKDLRRKSKHRNDINLALRRMNKVFNKNFYIRVFNRSGNIVLYIKILDAYFVGSGNYIIVDDRSFDGRYFFVDKKWLFKRLFFDIKFKKHLFFVQGMLQEIIDSKRLSKFACDVLFETVFCHKKSLFNLVKKYKEVLKKGVENA